MYCSTDDVYNATTLTTNDVSALAVESFIKSAEKHADLFTFTTYWDAKFTGTATAGGNSTLTDTGSNWSINTFENMYVWIYSGTGAGQIRKIVSNTTEVITVETVWATNPDTTSIYRIFYSASDPYISEKIDGDGTNEIYLDNYPLRVLESLTINSTSVTPANVYQYTKIGKLLLGDDSEVGIFYNHKPQLVDIAYWWGVYPLPYEVKRYCIVLASLSVLSAQMGGTHNIPSTYTLPEGSVTVGQAYINIRGTFDVLMKEKADLELVLKRYPHIL